MYSYNLLQLIMLALINLKFMVWRCLILANKNQIVNKPRPVVGYVLPYILENRIKLINEQYLCSSFYPIQLTGWAIFPIISGLLTK